MTKIGFVTIGQSPRHDMQDIWKDLIGIAEVIEIGALDTYSQKDIENRFNSKDGKDILVTRLRNGQVVRISKDCIYNLVQEAVDRLEQKNSEIIVLLCTGDFIGIKTKAIFIELNKLLIYSVKIISDNKRIGIIIPDKGQKEQLLKRWVEIGITPEVFIVNPYGDKKEIYETAHAIKDKELDIIILDCMGYDEKTQNIFQEITNTNVVLPRKLVNRFIKSII